MSDVLSQLGLTLDLDPEDMISDAVLIMKIHRPNGEVYVGCRQTEGTDWITARGLIAAAEDVESGGYAEAHDEGGG